MLGSGRAVLMDLATGSQPGKTHSPTLSWHRGPRSFPQPWAKSQGTLAQPQERDLHGMRVHRTKKRMAPITFPVLSGDTENGAPVPLSFWQRPQWGSSSPLAVTRPLGGGSGATTRGLQGVSRGYMGVLGLGPSSACPESWERFPCDMNHLDRGSSLLLPSGPFPTTHPRRALVPRTELPRAAG